MADSSRDYKQENSYCAAVRGNGELMPAHWGAMARLVERYGIPSAMAGGSSASITLFLMESISLNPLANSDLKRSLLIKSIEGYFETLTHTSEGKALSNLLSNKEELRKTFQKLIAHKMNIPDNATAIELMALKAKHLKDIEVILESSDLKEVLNPELSQYIAETIALGEKFTETNNQKYQAMANYRYSQVQQAFNNFGKFSTLTDNTLFFRPGLISFSKVGKLFGRLANFYASYGLGRGNRTKEEVDSLMTQFLDVCSKNSKGKSWQQIVKGRPVCRQMLGQSVLEYRGELKRLERSGARIKYRIEEKIGKHLATFPTTSILIKKAVPHYKRVQKKYLMNSDIKFEHNFKVHPTQYRFGYWGNEKELKTIEKNLKSKNGFIDGRGERLNFSKDKKSQKFTSLGDTRWLDALSLSPAEPGLARILPMNGRDDLLSAGGWNDLHPTLVLRALGCRNIMYVTRRGGDSMFGQGVVKKLTHIGGFNWKEWENLSASEKRLKNARGDRGDVGERASSWSKLYNLSNPKSSFSKSIEVTDGVWCSDWDQQDIRKGMSSIIADGYNAPLYNRSSNQFFKLGKNMSLKEYDSQLLRESQRSEGKYKYSGCLLNKL
jgi:hypothetical protein